jgi:uncharacterized membrane protein YgaE (UPF0421/DUF939 family)
LVGEELMANLIIGALVAVLGAGLVYLVAGLLLPHPIPFIAAILVLLVGALYLLGKRGPL